MTTTEYIEKIRIAIKDNASLNRLTGEVEHTDSDIGIALEAALDDFNQHIPETAYTIENFFKWTYLRDSAIVELLVAQGILFDRNSLPYNDGSVSINDMEGKGITYANWANRFAGRVERFKDQWKVKYNLEKGWGGVKSEYSTILGESIVP